MAINVTDLNNRCVTTSTVGYMALALTGWMLSMTSAGWYDHFYLAGTSLMLPFAILLAIIGILAYLHGRSLDSIAFFAFAVLFAAAHTSMATAAGAAPLSYIGWFWIVWTVFFAYVWLGSFRAELPRQLFFLGIALTFLAKAIHGWTDIAVVETISGYLGLISSIIAAIISASDVVEFGRQAHSPNDDRVDHADHAAGHPHAA